jgi:hypothetical protein
MSVTALAAPIWDKWVSLEEVPVQNLDMLLMVITLLLEIYQEIKIELLQTIESNAKKRKIQVA